MPLLTITGQLLQKLRLMKNIKQETMAKKLDISQPRYCQLEKKESLSSELSERLIDILNYTAEEVENMKKLLLSR